MTFNEDKTKIICLSVFCDCEDYDSQPNNSTDLGYVGYENIPNNPSIGIECDYCHRSYTFQIRYDTVEKILKIQCEECKKVLDIENHKDIKEERRKGIKSVYDWMTEK